MDRHKLRANRRCAASGATHRVRDVVQLEVQKHVLAERAQRLNDLRPGGGKQFTADFIEVTGGAEPIDHGKRKLGAGKIERDDRHRTARTGWRTPRRDFRSRPHGALVMRHFSSATAASRAVRSTKIRSCL